MHSGAVCSVDALQSLLVPYVTLANLLAPTQRVLNGLSRRLEDGSERQTRPAAGTAGYRRATNARPPDRRGRQRTPNTPSTRPVTILLTPYETTRSSAASVS